MTFETLNKAYLLDCTQHSIPSSFMLRPNKRTKTLFHCRDFFLTKIHFFSSRIVGYGISGCDPKIMGIGPVPAIRAMMAKTGRALADVDQVRIHFSQFKLI